MVIIYNRNNNTEVFEASKVLLDITTHASSVIVNVTLTDGSKDIIHLPRHMYDVILDAVRKNTAIDLTSFEQGNGKRLLSKDATIPPVAEDLGEERSIKVVEWFKSLSPDEDQWLRDNYSAFYNACDTASNHENFRSANYFLGDFRCIDVYNIQQSLYNRRPTKTLPNPNLL